MKYPAYPKYKPSGVEWLGEVPEHWEVIRLKTAATYWVSNVNKVASQDELPVRLCNYTDVYNNDYVHPNMDLMQTTATADEIRRFRLHVNDVVITKDSEEWNDIAVPALIIESAPDFICGYHLAIIRSNQQVLHGRFLLRSFQSCTINQQFQIAATGVTRYGLPKSSIGEALILLPQLPEQRAIADFLDRETARLDTLVAKKRELIEKLKEKRTALISRTVTRGVPPEAARAAGLDPYPKLKPSGIEWLGEVPEHWEIVAFKRLCKRVDVGIAEAATHAYCDDGIPIIRSTNVRANVLDTQDVLRIEKWFADKNRSKILHTGDLVTVRTGYPGTTAVIPDEYEGSQCFTLVISTTKPTEYPQFFSYFFNSDPGVTHFQMEGWGTAQTNISVPIVQHMSVLRPPAREQRAIVDYLDRETAKIEQMAAKVEEAIARLQEYRTALITAAVTGMIDVREYEDAKGESNTKAEGSTQRTLGK